MKSAARRQFWDCFESLPADVQRAARRAFALWQENPAHPSLDFKRVHAREPLFSVRVGLHWQALALRENDTYVWFWIGSHAEYDRLLRRT
jgi:hypothetical protein